MQVSILIIRQERPEDYDTVYHVVKPNASKAKDVIEITLKWIKNILQINQVKMLQKIPICMGETQNLDKCEFTI